MRTENRTTSLMHELNFSISYQPAQDIVGLMTSQSRGFRDSEKIDKLGGPVAGVNESFIYQKALRGQSTKYRLLCYIPMLLSALLKVAHMSVG